MAPRSITSLSPTPRRIPIGQTRSPRPGGPAATTLARSLRAASGSGVLRPHAQGGLGAVFVALDEELHREVALKRILDQHADDPTSRARFVLEAEITGGLEHPGIVPVYGLCTDPGGRPYYAMRFIRGDSLKEAIARFHADRAFKQGEGSGSLELRKLLRSFTDVCNAIEYAHSRGILHRDIKPSNVIVGNHGETLVVDWGLAKASGRFDLDGRERMFVPSSASGSAETLPGSVMGTPAYMSPEQARGELERLGPASDVCSLGATLYCLLTGRAPFERDDVGAVLQAVQRGDFPPPRQVVPAIDAALEAVCLKAMAQRPEDRYGSARALAEDLERWAADEPVTAWREPIGRRARRWARRHRTPLAVAAAALLVAAVGLGAVAAVQTDARNRLSRFNLALRTANTDAARARDLAEGRVGLALEALGRFSDAVDANLDVKNLPENAPLRQALLKGPLEFYRRLRDDLAAAGEARPESRAGLADAYARLARLTADLGSQADALAAYDQAAVILAGLARSGSIKPHVELARILAERGVLRAAERAAGRGRGRFATALEIREALERDEPGAAAHPIARARILQSLAELRSGSGDVAAALFLLERSRQAADEALRREPGNPEARMAGTRAIQRRGAILQEQKGRLPEARIALEAAVAELEPAATARPEGLDLQLALADAYSSLANVRDALGEHAEALARRAQAADRGRRLGPRPADLGRRPAHTPQRGGVGCV